MNFIKKIFQDNPDESVHRQFIRFGKGTYNRRALLSLWKTKNIKIKGSFEFANDFSLFVAQLKGSENLMFNGNIWSKNRIESLPGGIKKAGKWIYNVKDLSGKKISEISDEVYYFLLNADGQEIKLRTKSKLPKPGKGENKIDDKFCQLEFDEKYYNEAKSDFFWDVPECKKASVEHKFIIDEIVLPKGEEDYAKIREMAKRKGKIVRTITADGRQIVSEKNFEA